MEYGYTMKHTLLAATMAFAFSAPAGAVAITAKAVKKIANQEITRRVPELRGQTGPQGPQGQTGAQGPQGQIGAQGPQGQIGAQGPQGHPMAYALVHKDGTIDAARSFGVDQWDIYFRPNDHDGYAIVDYCFSGPRPKGIQVTVEREETLKGPQPQFTEWHSIGHQEMPPAPLSYPVLVTGLGPGENCPEDTEFYVKGFNSTDGAKGWAAFFLTLVL